MVVEYGSRSDRTWNAITTSSSEAFPARSPMPLTVHSIWRAPPSTAAMELATARPRSSWQWVLKITSSPCGTRDRMVRKKSRVSSGVRYPTVSGRLIVVAPALIVASITRHRKSMSLRVASSAENSTSEVCWRAKRTASAAASRHWSRDILSFAWRCRSDVAMNVWMRPRAAGSMAHAARSRSAR